MRSEREMLELIINTAKEDSRIRGVVMSGSRADIHAPRDIYQDYDIVYLVEDVAPFWNNTEWLEEKFGRISLLQTPEIMSLIPPDNDGSFVFLTIFEDGNRIDLSVTGKPYIDNGEPAIVLLDKTGELSGIKPREDFWFIKPPVEKLFHDCCNEFHWCLNNVAKAIARQELSLAMEQLNHYVRDMLMLMLGWYIGAGRDFKVSVGKNGKLFRELLPGEMYDCFVRTYSDGDFEHMWRAGFEMLELFGAAARSVAKELGFAYDEAEEQGIRAYMELVRSGALEGREDK